MDVIKSTEASTSEVGGPPRFASVNNTCTYFMFDVALKARSITGMYT